MGNVHDKSEEGEECHCDTLARDITYRDYRGSSEQLTPQSKPKTASKDALSNSAARKKPGVARSNSNRRRPSFKAKRTNSVKNKFFRSTSKERKGANNGSFMISDMEIQVDGKVAKLVPRKSVLKRKETPDQAVKVTKTDDQKIESSVKQRVTTKHQPKDSKKASNSQGLRVSGALKLSKRPSYEAAVLGKETKVTSDTKENTTSVTATQVSALPRHIASSDASQNKRWSNIDFAPGRDAQQRKQRPHSAYINANNNNNVKSSTEQNEFVGIWRVDSSKNIDYSKRRSMGHDVYKELSGEMSKLALVSPITDV